jgi:hypothetical protein
MFGWLKAIFGSTGATKSAVVREFYNSVAGVSFKNSDRTSRQIIGESVYAGMKLGLRLDDDNKHDRDAVAVLTPDGRQIGFLERRRAGQARGWMREGLRVVITVKEVTGGSDKEYLGVNILVQVLEDVLAQAQ